MMLADEILDTEAARYWAEWLEKGDRAETVSAAVGEAYRNLFPHTQHGVPIQPVILTDHGARLLHAVTEGTRRLVLKALATAGVSPAERAANLGLDMKYLPLMQEAAPARAFAASMVRPDISVHNGIPYVLELNVHSDLGGVPHTHLLNKAMLSSWVPEGSRILWSNSPLAARHSLLSSLCEQLAGTRRPRVAIIGSVADLSVRHPRYFTEEVTYLNTNGMSAAWLDPAELECTGGRLHSGSTEFDVALRLLLTEEASFKFDISALMAAAAGDSTIVLASDECVLAKNKLLLAWLSEPDRVPLSKEERAFVEKHIPWTRELADRSPSGAGGNLVDKVIANREHLIIKPASGKQAEGVTMGPLCTPAQWREAVLAALSEERRFVVQRYVPPDPIDLVFYSHASNMMETRRVRVLLGPFSFAGRYGGCLVRQHVVASDAPIAFHSGVVFNSAVVAG